MGSIAQSFECGHYLSYDNVYVIHHRCLSRSDIRISDEDHLSYFAQMPTQLPAGCNPSSPQIKLLSEWFGGVKDLNVEILGKHMHKDFRRSTYPHYLGLPEQSREECLQEAAGIMSITTEVDVGYTLCY
jgi:hypothetical protein